jgi:hypothetical protein
MSKTVAMLIVASVFFFGTGLTIKRGWFPFPFFRIYRDRETPVFWLIVVLNTAGGIAVVIMALFAS